MICALIRSCNAAPATAAACAALLLADQALAQPAPTPTGANANRTVNLNYVYAAQLGFGGYSLAGLSADVYTLPLADTLQNLPYEGWALKLLLPVQAGIYSFRATDVGGQRIAIDQQSVSVVPGAELQIPLGERIVMKPFAQVGEAHAFGTGAGNADSWIFLAGVRALTQWHAGDYTISLGNAVVYAGDQTIGPGFAEHYVSLQLGAEVRRPLGFQVGDIAPDIGVYVADYYYPAPLQFSRFLKPTLRVANQNEIGLSIGSATPFQMLWLANPRIGVGFVFGGGLNVWHVNFGFQF
ncbi:MAG TPA: hypothetical protein VGC82_21770 [Rhodopila sp.]